MSAIDFIHNEDKFVKHWADCVMHKEWIPERSIYKITCYFEWVSQTKRVYITLVVCTISQS